VVQTVDEHGPTIRAISDLGGVRIVVIFIMREPLHLHFQVVLDQAHAVQMVDAQRVALLASFHREGVRIAVAATSVCLQRVV
jgi:hypothetical protein